MTDTVTILAEAFEDHQRGAAAPGTSLFEFMAKRLAAASPQGEGSSADAEPVEAAAYDDVVLRADRDGKLQIYSSRFNSVMMTFERSMPERQRRELFARLVAAPGQPPYRVTEGVKP